MGYDWLKFYYEMSMPSKLFGLCYNSQLLFLKFSVGRTRFLHLDLKYAESLCPVNVLPALTPLPCIPSLHRFTCVTGTCRCPLKSLFGFCDFFNFSNLYLAFVCLLCFYFCLLCVFFIVLYVNLCSNG